MVFVFDLVYIYGLLLSPEPGRRYNKRAIIPLSQNDVNNSKYVVLAERGLSPALLKKMQLKHIAVSYKKAVKLGDFVKVETQQDESSSLHQVESPQDKSVFARVAFAWRSLSQGKDCR